MWPKERQGPHLFLTNKIKQTQKLITLKLSKPQNSYCGVLDGDKNGCRPSQSRHPSHPLLVPFHILDFGTGCHQCRQPPNSAILAQKHPRSVQSPQTPEDHPRSWCECPFQLWITLTPLPGQQQGVQAASSHYSKEKISRRKEGLSDVQFPHSQKLDN